MIGDLGGRVQWTKDGLTLGKAEILHNVITLADELIFLGYYRELPGFSRYSVLGSDESGVFNLQIINATLEDESVYECQVGPNGTNKPIRANAKLNVLCKLFYTVSDKTNKINIFFQCRLQKLNC